MNKSDGALGKSIPNKPSLNELLFITKMILDETMELMVTRFNHKLIIRFNKFHLKNNCLYYLIYTYTIIISFKILYFFC